MIGKAKAWLIHKLGGYTGKEIFAKAMEIAQQIHIRKMGTEPVEYDEEDEDMRDCGGCQYWDGDDGICHHPAHLGQETQNGCEHKEG